MLFFSRAIEEYKSHSLSVSDEQKLISEEKEIGKKLKLEETSLLASRKAADRELKIAENEEREFGRVFENYTKAQDKMKADIALAEAEIESVGPAVRSHPLAQHLENIKPEDIRAVRHPALVKTVIAAVRSAVSNLIRMRSNRQQWAKKRETALQREKEELQLLGATRTKADQLRSKEEKLNAQLTVIRSRLESLGVDLDEADRLADERSSPAAAARPQSAESFAAAIARLTPNRISSKRKSGGLPTPPLPSSLHHDSNEAGAGATTRLLSPITIALQQQNKRSRLSRELLPSSDAPGKPPAPSLLQRSEFVPPPRPEPATPVIAPPSAEPESQTNYSDPAGLYSQTHHHEPILSASQQSIQHDWMLQREAERAQSARESSDRQAALRAMASGVFLGSDSAFGTLNHSMLAIPSANRSTTSFRRPGAVSASAAPRRTSDSRGSFVPLTPAFAIPWREKPPPPKPVVKVTGPAEPASTARRASNWRPDRLPQQITTSNGSRRVEEFVPSAALIAAKAAALAAAEAKKNPVRAPVRAATKRKISNAVIKRNRMS